jgi:hypothetical protein
MIHERRAFRLSHAGEALAVVAIDVERLAAVPGERAPAEARPHASALSMLVAVIAPRCHVGRAPANALLSTITHRLDHRFMPSESAS